LNGPKARNPGTRISGIWNGSPVRGLRPARAARVRGSPPDDLVERDAQDDADVGGAQVGAVGDRLAQL
jgi:hypothetical protein